MALNAAKAALKQGKTALFICDMQEKFTKVIYEFDKIATNSSKLVNYSFFIIKCSHAYWILWINCLFNVDKSLQNT